MYMFPKDEKREIGGLKGVLRQLDTIGILLFAGAIILLLSFLLSFSTKPHYTEGVFGLLFVGLFIWRELKTEKPFIDVRLFKTHRKLSSVYIQFILLNIFFYCIFSGFRAIFRMKCICPFRQAG